VLSKSVVGLKRYGLPTQNVCEFSVDCVGLNTGRVPKGPVVFQYYIGVAR